MPSLVLQPDATDGKDTYIKADSATTNFGTLSGMYAVALNQFYECRPVLSFNLAGVPVGAALTAITLYVYNAGDTGGSDVANIVWRRILSANSGWTEAGATWNKRDGTKNWAGSVGCRTSGTDYSATELGSISHDAGAPVGTQSSGALDVTEMAAMVAANAGMIGWCTSTNTARNICSSDHATAAYRPKLVIDYTLPGSGGIFASSIFHSAIMGATLTR